MNSVFVKCILSNPRYQSLQRPTLGYRFRPTGIGYLTADSRSHIVGRMRPTPSGSHPKGYTAGPARDPHYAVTKQGVLIDHPPHLALPQAFSVTYFRKKAVSWVAKRLHGSTYRRDGEQTTFDTFDQRPHRLLMTFLVLSLLQNSQSPRARRYRLRRSTGDDQGLALQ